ncbi:MAG: DUF5610 domain-containing protein, partial [Gammaproteobacteria bacterium]|nr:DUF5610 domain-containing protein [Gammaproteobacteria bacterium]
MTDPISLGKSFTPDLRSNEDALQRDPKSSQHTLVQYSRSESAIVTINTTSTARPVVASNAVESTSPEQAANNVLQFIAQRLAGLKADGADAEVLGTALQKAQQGFARGLGEARDALQALNRLDDAQQQRLQRVEARFADGIEAIEQALRFDADFGDEVAAVTRAELGQLQQSTDNRSSQAATSATTAAAAPIASPTLTSPTPSLATASTPTASATNASLVNSRTSENVRVDYSEKQKFKSVEKYSKKIAGEREGREFPAQFINSYQSTRASFKRNESVELQLRTQDGDIVTLSFSAKQSVKFKFDANGSIAYDPQALGANVFAGDSSKAFSKLFGSSELNISVQGSIDDGELAALDDLFGQLSEVFSAFFSGDSGAALGQALQLEFDGEEIAQFSVDLQLSEKQKVVQRYREIAEFGGETLLGGNSQALNVG